MPPANGANLVEEAPPHNLEAERAVLASLMLNPAMMSGVLAAGLNRVHFHSPQYGVIFATLYDMHATGESIADPALVSAKLREAGELDYVGQSTIVELFDLLPIGTHAVSFAKQVIDVAKRARLIVELETAAARLRSGESIIGITADIHNANEAVLTENGTTVRYAPLTMAQLVAGNFDVEYDIDGMLVRGQPCVMLGASKSMKTTLALDLARSLATGGCFLGRFRCNARRRVYMMSGESGLGTIKETLLRQAGAAFQNLASIETLFIDSKLPRLKERADIEALRVSLKKLQIEILIIDPLYLCIDANGSEGSVYAMGAALIGVSQMCQDLGIGLVLVHHLRKTVANPYAPGELSEASWAGIGEFARQWIIINRREKYESGSGVHQLWVSGGGSAGHSFKHGVDVDEGISPNRHWNVSVVESEDVRESEANRSAEKRQRAAQERLEADLRKLLQVMAKFPDGETKTTLSTHTALSGERINRAIAEALRVNGIEECKITKNKRPEDAFKLRSDSP